MESLPGASELLSTLRSEHRELGAIVERLCRTEGKQLVRALSEFADLLEAHIRKEERALFPLYERLVSPDVAAEVRRAVTA